MKFIRNGVRNPVPTDWIPIADTVTSYLMGVNYTIIPKSGTGTWNCENRNNITWR